MLQVLWLPIDYFVAYIYHSRIFGGLVSFVSSISQLKGFVWLFQADSGARFLRYKSWPYYNDWKMVFGKDRASGHSAQDTDRANEINGSGSRDSNTGRHLNESQPGWDDGYEGVGMNDHGTADDHTDSVHSNVVDSERPAAKKKRKRGDAFDGLIDVTGKLHDDTNARLDRLSARIGYEFDVTKARKEVFQMMSSRAHPVSGVHCFGRYTCEG